MIWVDREVVEIKRRNLPLEWIDDMKTPSGRIHVGALRGVVIHDILYKVLLENGLKTKYTYVFDDHDPMDAIPSYLNFSKWEKYAGMQLFKIPSPSPGYKSFAQYYAKEFRQVFESINCHPEIIWASELYSSGKMNEVIKEVLDGAEKIRDIYLRLTKKPRPKDWYPFNVVCEKCKRIGTTYVSNWDGEYVYYRCLPQMVEWAKGCGYEGKVSPFSGNGKIPWKVEWAAKWKVIGVTLEGAGKDHMSKGGSHDIASSVCREVLNYPVPHPITYEWFTVGGRKMSSSKGIGTSSQEVSKILPSDVLRFLIVRTPIQTALDFNPFGETILNLFDDYDRCFRAYFDKIENKIPGGKPGEVLQDFARIIELSAVGELPRQRFFLPRFRTVVNLIKTKVDILSFFKDQKGKPLSREEKEILEERTVYAQVYLKSYAGETEKIEFLKKPPSDLTLTKTQQAFLKNLSDQLSKSKTKDRENIQQIVFSSIKKSKTSSKQAFTILYLVLIGRDSGPKAADLILEFGLDKATKRLKEVT